MPQKYIIKMECTKTALAELIALGLEQHASITQIEAMQAEQMPKPDDFKISFKHLPAAKPTAKIKDDRKTYGGRKIKGYDVYQLLIKNYHPQKTFKSSNIYDLAIAMGFVPTRNAISAHLSRMSAVGLLEQCGGNSRTGFVFRLTQLRNKREFLKMSATYDNRPKAREQAKSKKSNKWFSLAEFQKQHQYT